MVVGLEILLWAGAMLWIVLLLQTIINTALVRDVRQVRMNAPAGWPLVSIVVPARNEERGLREAITSFCMQDYPSFEVIVVDDRSTDATPHILAELQSRFSNLNVVPGHDPPPGWLGKPHALELGRRQARGDWLLFVDADVVYAPDLLRRAIAHALQEQVGMLSLIPRLHSERIIEAVILSTLYLVAFAVFPMFLVSRTRCWWLATGGGIFNLVRRDALEAGGAFACLRDAVIDDAGLGWAVKRAGFKEVVALAGPLIRLRMYDGVRETVEGFTKNVYPGLMRTRPWTVVIPLAAGTLLSLLPYCGFVAGWAVGSPSIPATLSLCCMHVVLGMIAAVFRQPWYIAFLNPLRELCWWWILLLSFARYRRRGLVWRGREYTSLSPNRPS